MMLRRLSPGRRHLSKRLKQTSTAARRVTSLPSSWRAWGANGVSDGAIGEALRGDPVTRAEMAAVQAFKNMRHGDPEWVSRLLKGGYAERREHELMSIVLSSEIREG